MPEGTGRLHIPETNGAIQTRVVTYGPMKRGLKPQFRLKKHYPMTDYDWSEWYDWGTNYPQTRNREYLERWAKENRGQASIYHHTFWYMLEWGEHTPYTDHGNFE